VATSVKGAFATFKQNLEITGLQEATVSTRQTEVREALEAELTVKESFLTGSYRRHTMIAPLKTADVDVVVVLDPKYYQENGQVNLLEKVKSVLRKTYTRTPAISRNGQAVTITFADFAVDVVPAFYRTQGGFLIPSTDGIWIPTDPKKHAKISGENNQAHDGDLVPLEKMLKCWNRNIGYAFRSFHLEVLAWSILEGVTISDYSSGVRYYFDKARALIKEKNPDPAGYAGDVGHYLNSSDKIQSAVSRFETAYNRARNAEQYAEAGAIQAAIDEWRKIFGTAQFPAHG
jgi:hypothetical protein